MSSSPVTVNTVEPIQRLAALLLDTDHGGFPVTKEKDGLAVSHGFINRYGGCRPVTAFLV